MMWQLDEPFAAVDPKLTIVGYETVAARIVFTPAGEELVTEDVFEEQTLVYTAAEVQSLRAQCNEDT